MIIVKGEDCWLVGHTNENGWQTTYTYPLLMNKEEVIAEWTLKAICGYWHSQSGIFGER